MSKILRNRFGIGSVRNLTNSAERFGSVRNHSLLRHLSNKKAKHGEICVLQLMVQFSTEYA